MSTTQYSVPASHSWDQFFEYFVHSELISSLLQYAENSTSNMNQTTLLTSTFPLRYDMNHPLIKSFLFITFSSLLLSLRGIFAWLFQLVRKLILMQFYFFKHWFLQTWYHYFPSKAQQWCHIVIFDEFMESLQRNYAYNGVLWYLSQKDDLNSGIIEVEMAFHNDWKQYVAFSNQERSIFFKAKQIFYWIGKNKNNQNSSSSQTEATAMHSSGFEVRYPSPMTTAQAHNSSQNNNSAWDALTLHPTTVPYYSLPMQTIQSRNVNYIILSTKEPNNQILKEFVDFSVNQCRLYFDKAKWKQRLFSLNEDGRWKSEEFEMKRPLESVVLDSDIKLALDVDLQVFFSQRELFERRGIPYHRNYLFFGPPGSGKSSLVIGLSQKYQKDLAILSLQDIESDAKLRRLCEQIDSNCILVLEDVDCISNRKEVLKTEEEKQHATTGFTLGCLLNILDGIYYKHGRMIILTTNYPEKLDAALLRAGRCHLKLRLDWASREQIWQLFETFFKKEYYNDSIVEVVDDLLQQKDKYIAQFPNKIVSMAEVQEQFVIYSDEPQKALEAIIDYEKTILKFRNAHVDENKL